MWRRKGMSPTCRHEWLCHPSGKHSLRSCHLVVKNTTYRDVIDSGAHMSTVDGGYHGIKEAFRGTFFIVPLYQNIVGDIYTHWSAAIMGKLSAGRPDPHMLKSKGGDTDVMKFYCTQYGTTYGKKFSKFQPRNGKHTGTGYLSNFRPGVYYNEKLDEIDNPSMGRLVSTNYHTITENSFRPSTGPTGLEPLPNSCKQVGSGFIREKPLTIPTYNEVKDVLIDTRVASAPAEVMPRHKPLLHKLHPKDPVELENSGYGPGFMTTETQERFKGHQPHRDTSKSSIGPKEGSGFTHAYNIEPITFQPDSAHEGKMPAYLTHRPTGVSIMQTHYRPTEFSHGAEPLPSIANRSDHETGFTNGTKPKPEFVHKNPGDAYDKATDMPGARLDKIRQQDPAEYLNATHPNNHSSMAAAAFKGQQFPSKSEPDRLGRTAVGIKEGTGYTENNDRFVQTADNPTRFVTHYMTRFLDRTPQGLDRAGHTWGGVQPQKQDGFTRSTSVHEHGPTINSTSVIRNLEPYVARSLKAKDSFFDDHTYDSKLHSSMAKCSISA